MEHLEIDEKLKLTSKGERHQSVRDSFVDNAVKTSMMPIDDDQERREITDKYAIHPFVENGK